MPFYAGIDLHSNNNFLVVLDEADRVHFKRRLPNDLDAVLASLLPFHEQLAGVVVESTYNWYWLVDGLQEAGFKVHLANTAAIRPYEGLKSTDDASDAAWLAHLLRLGLLPEGYIYPQAERPWRDLLRKRMQLVQLRSLNHISLGSLLARQLGHSPGRYQLKTLSAAQLDQWLPDPPLRLAAGANHQVARLLDEQLAQIERVVLGHLEQRPAYGRLQQVYGIGTILSMVILLETGAIGRFASAGAYASYCRLVDSCRTSNGKKKGENNRKCGNKYLSWAFIEAASAALRYPEVKRFYQRKKQQKCGAVGFKAVAHKLARACFYILRDEVAFDPGRLFAG
jgi:transposase